MVATLIAIMAAMGALFVAFGAWAIWYHHHAYLRIYRRR